MYGPALRLGSKIHSILRLAKKGKEIGNGSQIGVGEQGEALDWFLSNPVITEAKSTLPGQGSNGRNLALLQGKSGAQISMDLGTTCKILYCCKLYLPY